MISSSRSLVSKLIRFERSAVIRLLLVAAVLGLLVTWVETVRQSTDVAIATTLESKAGGRRWIATSASNDEQVLSRLAASDAIDSIWYGSGAAQGRSRRVGLEITWTGEPNPQLGIIRDGRPLQSIGEVIVTPDVASGLDSKLGDVVGIEGEMVTIVGIFTWPTEPRASEAILVRSDESQTSRWPDAYLVDKNAPRDLVDQLLVRSVSSHVGDDDPYLGHVVRVSGVLTTISPGIWVVAVFLLAGVVIRLGRVRRSLFVSLGAAGLRSAKAKSLLRRGAGAVIGAGLLGGIAAGLLLLAAFQSVIASLLGQDWPQLSIPWLRLAMAMAFIATGLFLVGRSQVWVPGVRQLGTRGGMRLGTAAALVAGAMLVAVPQSLGPLSAAGGVVGSALIGLGVLGLVASSGRFHGASIRRLLETVGPARSTVAMAAIVAAAIGAYGYAAISWERQIALQYDIGDQPEGTLILETVDRDDAEHLLTFYEETTGRDAFELVRPDESMATVRVVSAAAGRCISEFPDLFQGLAVCEERLRGVEMNEIAIDVVTSAPELDNRRNWLAGPQLLEGTGEVSVISFDTESAEIHSIETVQADPLTVLGGYSTGALSPSAVEPPAAGRQSVVVFEGFTTLALDEQAKVQSEIFRRAGYSLVFLEQTEDYGLLGVQLALLAISTLLVLLLTISWGESFLDGAPNLDVLLRSLHLSGRRSLGLFVAASAPLPVATVMAAVLGTLFAALSTGRPFGVGLVVPAVYLLATIIGLAISAGLIRSRMNLS